MAASKKIKLIANVNSGIFPANISFCVGYSYDEICAYYKKIRSTDWLLGLRDDKTFIDKNGIHAMRRSFINPKTNKEVILYYIIITRFFDWSDWDFCMLAHEVLHICQFMLPDFLDREKEHECEAYLHTHIMQQCLKLLRTGKNV